MADDEDDQDQESEGSGFKDLEVQSSCFSRLAYDAGNKTLLMQFVKGGVYQIEGIEAVEVDRWINSGSPGGYFNSFVRGAY